MRSAALAAATLAGATCVVAPSVGAAPAVAAAPAAVTAISVTSPATGNTWVHGQKVNITWSATGAATADKVKIDLYKGTTKVVAISASTGAAAGTFEYTIPTTLEAGNDYKVTISSIATSPVSDDSDTFSVAKPGLTSVTTPGANWVLGKKYEVVWDALGDPGNVAVTLTKAGGTPVTISVSGGAKATDEKLSYTVPVTLPTGSYTLKVASVNPSSTVTPVVSNAFNVVAPVVAVSTPDNAQAVPLGGQATINWTVNPASETPYKVELVDTTGTEDTVVLAASVAPATNGASGSFVWTVATDVVGDGTEAAGDVIGADFVVRVTAVTTSGTTVVTGDSARFSIVVPGIAVGAMSAVRAGGEATITWAVQPGISGQAKIELTDGADPISTIVETIDASLGTYTWQVPVGILDDPSTVRLTMLNDDRVTGDSPEFTPALPAITVTTDTTTYAAGTDTIEVSWTIANSIELPVKVELFKGTTNTATMAFFVEAGTTTYEWDVPAGLTAGTDYKVTVSAIGNDDLTDDSADFAVT